MLFVKLTEAQRMGQSEEAEGLLKGLEMDALCRCVLDLAFAHSTNNLFLSKFRALMGVLKVHCVAQLKYLVVECAMMARFQQFYEDASRPRVALHAYIVAVVWDVYEYHE